MNVFGACGLALVLLGSFAARGEKLPALETNSLTGRAVKLPDAASGRAAILVIGFTSASAKATAAWRTKIDPAFAGKAGYVIYSVAVLEDVPRLIRGLVTGAIRKQLPEKERDRFLTVFKDESVWKQVVRYGEKDDAYVLLLSPSGEVLERAHGTGTEAECAGFRQRVLAERASPLP